MPLHCIVSNIENVIVNILDKDIAAKMWDIFGAKNWRPLWDIKTKVCYHPKWISSVTYSILSYLLKIQAELWIKMNWMFSLSL